jgi:hypothetical protein
MAKINVKNIEITVIKSEERTIEKNRKKLTH